MLVWDTAENNQFVPAGSPHHVHDINQASFIKAGFSFQISEMIQGSPTEIFGRLIFIEIGWTRTSVLVGLSRTLDP